jgi:hypothetical protein
LTTIAGIETDQGVVLAGDHRVGVGEGYGFIGVESKLWRLGDIVMGLSGPVRASQAIRHNLVVPVPDRDGLTAAWMATDMVAAVRQALAQSGNGLPDETWSLLMGVGNELWCLDASMAVTRSHHGFFAIGSGSDWALGSLFTTQVIGTEVEGGAPSPHLEPEARLYMALAATAEYSFQTAPPFDILNNYPYPEEEGDSDGSKIIPIRGRR